MSCGRRSFPMHPAEVEEEDRFWWTRGPVFPPVVRPGPGAGAPHLTPASGSSGGGSPADSVTSSPPLRRALIGRNLPRGPSPQLAPLGVGDTSPDSGGGGGGGNGLRSQGLLTTVDSGGRMTMYSKPPPLTIPPSVSSGSSGHIVPPIPPWCQTNTHRQRQYHNPRGATGYNGPPPGLTSVAYRSFPGGPGQALGGGALSPPPPPMLTASPSGQPPSPPPTMPGRECKFCKNNGETAQMYRSHSLRNPSDGRLICPVLRDHVCEMCGATGDDAHTRNYCPLNAERKKQAIPLFLKNTRRQSDGHYRL